MSYRYPYGNTEQMNLDWFLNQWEKFKADWAEAEAGIDGSLDAEIAKVEAAMSELYAARDAAAASATAARQSSLDAAAAQVAAGNSKTAAQAAETAARGSQTAAAQSAQEAQASAQGAENSALTASQAANTATQQAAGADAAKGAAEAAQQAAEDAQAAAAQSAGQAGQAATAAADHADDAADSATLAQQAAQDMSDSVAQITTNKNDISDLKESITQETGRNLFNVDEAVDGYLDSSGNIAVLGDWKTTGFIPVSGLTSIIASSVTGTSGNRSFNPLYFLNTYRADKTRIGKVWDSCTNGKYTIGEDVGYIRFSYHNYAWNVNLMVESGEIYRRYRPYEKFNALKNSPYLDEKELVKDKEELDIVCWGDSLTYSQYGTNITYPQKLSELITATNRVHNFGVAGEKTLAIATRQGAYPFNVPPCTIPSSGNVVVSATDIFGNAFTTLLHNAMRDGQLELPSALTINGKSYGIGYEGNNQYRIANIGTGNEEMTLQHGAVAKMFGELYRNSIPIFWAGTNDTPATADDAEHITRIIKAMANYSNRDEYLVLGLTVKSYADTVNASLAYEFGQHYVDVKSYLINYGLDINNITPTEQDTTDIANGVIPTSLRYDSVHFNDYGYIAVATCVYEAGKDLGYWK